MTNVPPIWTFQREILPIASLTAVLRVKPICLSTVLAEPSLDNNRNPLPYLSYTCEIRKQVQVGTDMDTVSILLRCIGKDQEEMRSEDSLAYLCVITAWVCPGTYATPWSAYSDSLSV